MANCPIEASRLSTRPGFLLVLEIYCDRIKAFPSLFEGSLIYHEEREITHYDAIYFKININKSIIILIFFYLKFFSIKLKCVT